MADQEEVCLDVEDTMMDETTTTAHPRLGEEPQVTAGQSEVINRSAPPLPSDPRDPRYREVIEAHIRAGSIDESAGLAAIREADKLPKLKPALEKRLEELEILLHSPMASNHITNIAAVLEGYKSGTLTWLEGQYYIFRDGRRVAGPRPMAQFDAQKVLFEEFPGPRSVWLEVCRGPRYLLPAFRQTLYADEAGHHHYPVRVRSPDTEFSLPFLFLDDTGSTSPTIHPIHLFGGSCNAFE